MKTILIPLLLMLPLAGCITSSYNKSNEEYRHVFREFDFTFPGTHRVYRGTWGETLVGGKKYRLFQFQGVLKGEGRLFSVMVPDLNELAPEKAGIAVPKNYVDSLGSMQFTDSEGLASGDRPAYLLLQRMMPMDDMKSFYALFNQKKNLRSDPAALLKEHFGYDIEGPGYPLALVDLDVTLNYRYSARCIIWDRDGAGSTRVAYVGLDGDSYDNPRMDIGWSERNRPVYLLRQLGYAGTVIADIVTSPVQLVYVLLLGSAGGVR
jgi:hypothetical protein